MKIYISGICGTGMGPLALMAKQVGHEVSGSDTEKGAIYDELVAAGIDVHIGEQDGKFLQKEIDDGLRWFIYTSALPQDHPELLLAKKAGANVKVTKRDAFTAYLVNWLGLKMVAVAGTHGKTTTTAMIIWTCLKLDLPVSYVVGTTLGFAPSGSFRNDDEYFIYEADEYDRNFLYFDPWLAALTTVSYDHPDIYKTPEEYKAAFEQFKRQSMYVLEPSDGSDTSDADLFSLAGKARREDAATAAAVVVGIYQDMIADEVWFDLNFEDVVKILNEFPGVGRRFERLSDGIYTDYAHHPEEIAATIDIAKEECSLKNKKGVIAIYQPHQNVRQHEVFKDYHDAFLGASKIYWLPTYLTRENPDLKVLAPEDFIKTLDNSEVAEAAKLNDELFEKMMKWRDEGYLVLLMTAGPADKWLRDKLK